MLHKQLRTIVDNVNASFLRLSEVTLHTGKAPLDVIITASVTLQFQKAIKILTGSAKYQGVDGYLCDNVAYAEIW